MSTENEKALDAFIRQLTNEIPLEEPHHQFTDKVLSSIVASGKRSSQPVHTPVFSQSSWIVVGAIAVSLLILGFLFGEEGTAIPDFLSFLPDRSKLVFGGKLPSIASSRILLFSSMAFISCVAIQIFWLKKSWSKKQVFF